MSLQIYYLACFSRTWCFCINANTKFSLLQFIILFFKTYIVIALFKKFLPIPDFFGGPVFLQNTEDCASNAGGMGLTADQQTKIPHTDKRKEKERNFVLSQGDNNSILFGSPGDLFTNRLRVPSPIVFIFFFLWKIIMKMYIIIYYIQ